MRKLVVLFGLVAALAGAPQALAAAPVLVSAGSVNGHATASWTIGPEVEPLVVEVSTSPDVNADGSFVSLDSGSFLFSTQTDWTDVFFLDPGVKYYVHVGGTDMSCPTCPLLEYSNVLSFAGTEGTGPDAPLSRNLRIQKAGAGSGSVTSDPGGINCGTACFQPYSRGGHVTLTPKAAPGSVFAGWDGGGCFGYSPTCEVTMNVTQTVVATFDLVAPPSVPDLIATRNSATATATFTVCDDSSGPLTIALTQIWQDKGQWKSATTTTTQNHTAPCDTHTVSGPLAVRSATMWIAVQVTDVDGRQGSLRTAPAP